VSNDGIKMEDSGGKTYQLKMKIDLLDTDVDVTVAFNGEEENI
jgi:hypothetical protein